MPWYSNYIQARSEIRNSPLAAISAVTSILALALFIPLIITRRLFTSDRLYPLLPVHPALTPLPIALEWVWYVAVLLLVLLVGVLPRPRLALISLCLLLFLWGLFDQNRLMPYYYQFFFMALALSTVSWREVHRLDVDTVENTLRLILASIYFWSGFHKFNIRYIVVGFPWLSSAWTEAVGGVSPAALSLMAIASALVEMLLGLLLLSRFFRRGAVIMLIAMHAIILLMIGPLGLNWNESVWSWNIAMMGFAPLLFWKTQSTFYEIIFGPWLPKFPLRPLRRVLHTIVLVLFLLLPALNYFGRWDDFLSHSMYTWATQQGYIEIGDISADSLPAEVRPHIQTDNHNRRIDFVSWAYGVYHSSPFYSPRLFLAGFKTLCAKTHSNAQLRLVLLGRPHWRSGKSSRQTLSCRDLAVKVSP